MHMKLLKLNKKIAFGVLLSTMCAFPAFSMSRIGKYLTGLGVGTGIGAATYMALSSPPKYANYRVPPNMKKVLDGRQQEIIDTFCKKDVGDYAHIFPWLPNYVIKSTVPGRLEGREYCANIIKQNPITMGLLEVPLKYYYPTSTKFQDYVISEKVEGSAPPSSRNPDSRLDKMKLWAGITKHKQLSLPQTVQLCNFIMESGWRDSRRDNYALRDSGHISIIDTQLQTFEYDNPLERKMGGIRGLNTLLNPVQQKYFSPECIVYIQQRLEQERLKTEQLRREVERSRDK